MVVDSIEKQLVSDKRLGCLLSGGLDSSIIVSIASKYYEKQKKKLPTFSLEFESNEDYFSPSFYQPSSDVPYIHLMVKKFDTNHTVIKLSNQDLLDALYKSVDARDLPGMADIDSSLLCFCEKLQLFNYSAVVSSTSQPKLYVSEDVQGNSTITVPYSAKAPVKVILAVTTIFFS